MAKPSSTIIWVGGAALYKEDTNALEITTKQSTVLIACNLNQGLWLEEVLALASPGASDLIKHQELKDRYERAGLDDFTLFWYGSTMEELFELGLLVV